MGNTMSVEGGPLAPQPQHPPLPQPHQQPYAHPPESLPPPSPLNNPPPNPSGEHLISMANLNSLNNGNNRAPPPNNIVINLGPGEPLFGNLRSPTSFASYFPFGRLVPPPPLHQTSTVKSFLNLHKDTVQLILHSLPSPADTGPGSLPPLSPPSPSPSPHRYLVQFKFDALEACVVRVFFLAKELQKDHSTTWPLVQASTEVGPIYCEKGMGQTFVQPVNTPWLDMGGGVAGNPEALTYNPALHQYPLIISLSCPAAQEGEGDTTTPTSTPSTSTSTATTSDQTDKANKGALPTAMSTAPIRNQTTYCAVLACGDGSYVAKTMMQKIRSGGRVYVVHDIYGLEGEGEGEGVRECVVCMSEARDTTVLPCRHMCLCSPCADLMRIQSNKCPICRAPVSSLLHITLSKDSAVGIKDPEKDDKPFANAKEDEEDEHHLLARRDKDKKEKDPAASPTSNPHAFSLE